MRYFAIRGAPLNRVNASSRRAETALLTALAQGSNDATLAARVNAWNSFASLMLDLLMLDLANAERTPRTFDLFVLLAPNVQP